MNKTAPVESIPGSRGLEEKKRKGDYCHMRRDEWYKNKTGTRATLVEPIEL